MPNLPPLVNNDPSLTKGDFLKLIQLSQEEYGDIFRLKFGKREFVFLTNPELAKELLITQASNFGKMGAGQSTTGLKTVLNNGLLTNTNYELWKKQRAILKPFFAIKNINYLAEDIIKIANGFIKKMKQFDNETIDLEENMLELSHKIIYKMVFSLSAYELLDYPLNVSLSLATLAKNKAKRASLEYDRVVYKLIEKRRQEDFKGYDFLAYMLAAQKEQGFSDQQLRDELLTVFAAGHEATANTLIWAFYILGTMPEVKNKLLQQLEPIAINKQITPADIKRLAYLDIFLKELLRLYPPIPSAPRVALQDTKIAGFDILKDTKVFLSIFANHMHPKYWQQPDVFRPERFLLRIARPAYMPFGMGERLCIGRNLALLEPSLIIPLVLLNLDFKILTKDVARQVSISLKPRHSIKAKVQIR